MLLLKWLRLLDACFRSDLEWAVSDACEDGLAAIRTAGVRVRDAGKGAGAHMLHGAEWQWSGCVAEVFLQISFIVRWLCEL